MLVTIRVLAVKLITWVTAYGALENVLIQTKVILIFCINLHIIAGIVVPVSVVVFGEWAVRRPLAGDAERIWCLIFQRDIREYNGL